MENEEPFTLSRAPAGKSPMWKPDVQDARQLKLIDQLSWDRDQQALFEEKENE